MLPRRGSPAPLAWSRPTNAAALHDERARRHGRLKRLLWTTGGSKAGLPAHACFLSGCRSRCRLRWRSGIVRPGRDPSARPGACSITRATAPGRSLAGTSRAICRRLRDRMVGAGAAPEFVPKRNSALMGNRGWTTADGARPAIGRRAGQRPLGHALCFSHSAGPRPSRGRSQPWQSRLSGAGAARRARLGAGAPPRQRRRVEPNDCLMSTRLQTRGTASATDLGGQLDRAVAAGRAVRSQLRRAGATGGPRCRRPTRWPPTRCGAGWTAGSATSRCSSAPSLQARSTSSRSGRATASATPSGGAASISCQWAETWRADQPRADG